MTLRLRLTLVIVLAVAITLLASGVGLHLLLRASLFRGLDADLRESAELLSRFVVDAEDIPALEVEDEVLFDLRSDLTALLLGADGAVLARLGAPLRDVPEARSGLSTQDDLRVLGERIGSATLLVVRDFDELEDSLERFDTVFLTLAPVALVAAALLGYVLAGRGLAPVDRLTRSALDLAERRAWRERLPEPRLRDELWRLARATNELLGALAGVIAREQRFTADAAHELRTPLTVLRGRLEQALEETNEAATRERLGKALTASEELLHLTETLLLLARSEAGQSEVFGRVALDEIAFAVAEEVRSTFREKGLALHLRLPEDPAWVRGDASALTVLLRNLLDNALKFTSSGSVALAVALDGAEVRTTVEDTGPGIPEADLPRVFERFFQSDVRHRRTGSGLGLALAQTIAVWHGGRLEASNRIEGGARITLVLPFSGEKHPEVAFS